MLLLIKQPCGPQNSNNSSCWHPKLSKLLNKKLLSLCLQILQKASLPMNIFINDALKSHWSVTFINILVSQWSRKHLFTCYGTRAVSVLMLRHHKAHLPCLRRWQQRQERLPQGWETPCDFFLPACLLLFPWCQWLFCFQREWCLSDKMQYISCQEIHVIWGPQYKVKMQGLSLNIMKNIKMAMAEHWTKHGPLC